jgi:hypothetical protein
VYSTGVLSLAVSLSIPKVVCTIPIKKLLLYNDGGLKEELGRAHQ